MIIDSNDLFQILLFTEYIPSTCNIVWNGEQYDCLKLDKLFSYVEKLPYVCNSKWAKFSEECSSTTPGYVRDNCSEMCRNIPCPECEGKP